MQFVLICILSLVVLGVVAALSSMFTKGGTDAPIAEAHDCATCSSVASGECKIGCLIQEKRQKDAQAAKGEIHGARTAASGEEER